MSSPVVELNERTLLITCRSAGATSGFTPGAAWWCEGSNAYAASAISDFMSCERFRYVFLPVASSCTTVLSSIRISISAARSRASV